VRRERPASETHCKERRRAERGRLADDRRDAAEHRPEQRSDDRGRHRSADRLATSIRRRLADQPGEPRRPGERAADTLGEPGQVEDEDRVARGEDEGRDRDQQQSGDGSRASAEARRCEPPREAAYQRAGGVGSGEHTGARLGQVELVCVLGQKRRERREEHRVDEHGAADEQQQPPPRPHSSQDGFRRSRNARSPS
jgi:hypothetical protein